MKINNTDLCTVQGYIDFDPRSQGSKKAKMSRYLTKL